MPSTFTANTGIEKIANGEQAGTWGTTTNLNFDILDRALNGSVTISLSGTTHTLTTSSGTLSDGQFAVLAFAGSPSDTNTVTIAPNTAQKVYLVRNTSGQTVILSQGSGATVSVPTGGSKIVYADGAGAGAAVVDIATTVASHTHVLNDIGDAGTMAAQDSNTVSITGGSITGITDLAIADGGTGASTAATARTNLGATTVGNAVFIAASEDAGQGALGATVVGKGLFTAASEDAGQDALGATAVGKSLFTVVSASSARESLDVLPRPVANGVVVRTGAFSSTSRTITGTANQITVTDGNGVSGDPTVAAVIATQAEAEAGTDNVKLMTALRTAQAIDEAAAALPEPVVDGVDLRNRVQAEVFADSGAWAAITGLAAVKAATFVLSVTSDTDATDRNIQVELSTDNGATWTSTATISKFRVVALVEIGATAFVELDEGIVALTGDQFGITTPSPQRAKYTAATYDAVRFRVGGSSAGGNSIRVIAIIEQGRAL